MRLIIEIELDRDPEYRNGEAGQLLRDLANRIYEAKTITTSWRSTLRDSEKKKAGTVRVVK